MINWTRNDLQSPPTVAGGSDALRERVARIDAAWPVVRQAARADATRMLRDFGAEGHAEAVRTAAAVIDAELRAIVASRPLTDTSGPKRERLEALAHEWSRRAARKYEDAEKEIGEWSKSTLIHGAACYANCAFELADALGGIASTDTTAAVDTPDSEPREMNVCVNCGADPDVRVTGIPRKREPSADVPADIARIDWLEALGTFDVTMGLDGYVVIDADEAEDEPRSYATLREAIDASMAAPVPATELETSNE